MGYIDSFHVLPAVVSVAFLTAGGRGWVTGVPVRLWPLDQIVVFCSLCGVNMIALYCT